MATSVLLGTFVFDGSHSQLCAMAGDDGIFNLFVITSTDRRHTLYFNDKATEGKLLILLAEMAVRRDMKAQADGR